MVNKKCSRCGVIKFTTDFYRHKNAKDGLQSNCKSCHSETSNFWRIRNPDFSKKWLSQYYVDNKERRKDYAKKWLEKNKARKVKANMEWKKNNKDASCRYAAERRARLIKAIPRWVNEFFVEEIYRLAQLRSKVTGIKYSVDHVVPLTSDKVCGLHWEGNLQVIPGSVNYSKANHFWPDMP